MTKNYLITGIPRSGTTLLTSLIAENLDSVAFSEPEWLKSVRNISDDCDQFLINFENQINLLRKQITDGIPVEIKKSRIKQGLPDNYYHRNDQGEIILDKAEVPVLLAPQYANKPFIIKANAQFTSCLTKLVKLNHTKISCVIRNPIATIMSWRALDLPVSRGHVKVAEKYNASFSSQVHSTDLLIKQVRIIDWFFKQFHLNKDHINLIRYEELVSDAPNILSTLIGSTTTQTQPMKSRNKSTNYNLEEEDLIKTMLIKHGSYYGEYYQI